jgi:hypothetical protein
MRAKKPSRNGHACHPIMRKGGVHQKTNKAKRKAEKLQTRHQAREGLSAPVVIGRISQTI